MKPFSLFLESVPPRRHRNHLSPLSQPFSCDHLQQTQHVNNNLSKKINQLHFYRGAITKLPHILPEAQGIVLSLIMPNTFILDASVMSLSDTVGLREMDVDATSRNLCYLNIIKNETHSLSFVS
jgi:hypothetical protein